MFTDDNKITWNGAGTHTYDSNGLTLQGDNGTGNWTTPNDVEISGEIYFYNTSNNQGQFPTFHNCICYKSQDYVAIYDELDSNAWANRTQKSITITRQVWHQFKVTFIDNTISLYVDDVLLVSKTVPTRTNHFTFFTGHTNPWTIKNIKVKPL